MPNQCQVEGDNAAASFTLKIHRGEGMALLAMNWRNGEPPDDFVGFAIEYSEPNSATFYPLKNRLTFDGNAGTTPSGSRPDEYSTKLAPIQKFRWVHFPRNADLAGLFTYRVTSVFMNAAGNLSYGDVQNAQIELARETIPGTLKVAFTRGFISSQAFVDNYLPDGPLDTLLPASAKDGLDFTPTHKDKDKALPWMGFEARAEILQLLKDAEGDPTAKVSIVAFDFNLPEIFDAVVKLKDRVRIIIDNSKDHTGGGAAEDKAETRFNAAGVPVKRQAMGDLQHNKMIVVDGTNVHRAVCGSTNMSWRGFYVQNNNAVLIDTPEAVKVFSAAFEQYWNDPDNFKSSASAGWNDLSVPGVDAKVAFSPHNSKNSVLKGIAADILQAKSSLFYSLAFLAITPGAVRNAIGQASSNPAIFAAGISDQKAGVTVSPTSSNLPPTYVAALDQNAPSPFKEEPTALAGTGGGTRMHHKFIVLDFNTDDARVYFGSYNMSQAADGKNGENLLLIKDRSVATSYMVEAVRIIDHYQFRAALKTAPAPTALKLQRPPGAGEKPWWVADYEDPRRIKDRLLFA